MQFIKDSSENVHIVTGLDAGAIRIDEDIVSGSIVLSATTVTSWPVAHVSELAAEHWETVLATEPEIVLLGTGATLVFPEPAQLARAYQQNIGVEIMNTEAACRTYNLLVHESRKVTAALILGD